MQEAMKFTGAKTKREAVVSAVEDFNRRHRLTALAKRLHGSMPYFHHYQPQTDVAGAYLCGCASDVCLTSNKNIC